jgi:hypothetical protein
MAALDRRHIGVTAASRRHRLGKPAAQCGRRGGSNEKSQWQSAKRKQ